MIHEQPTSQLWIVSSSPTVAHLQLRDTIRQRWSLDIETSPAVIWANDETEPLTIEAVRHLQQQVSYRSLGDIQVVVCPGIDRASLPAQQAMLKLLEEPPTATQVILTSSSLGTVLPTIQSRCRIEYLEKTVQITITDQERSKLHELYQQLTHGSIASTISLAGEYNTKLAALEITRQLLDFLHEQLQTTAASDLARTTQHLASLVQLYEHLQHNVAPRLALEETWLRWLT